MFALPRSIVVVVCALVASACASHSAAAVRRQHGETIYVKQCQACHGARGAGGPIGPPLRGESRRRTREAIAKAISDPDPPMPKLYPSVLSAADVRDVTAYVESL